MSPVQSEVEEGLSISPDLDHLHIVILSQSVTGQLHHTRGFRPRMVSPLRVHLQGAGPPKLKVLNMHLKQRNILRETRSWNVRSLLNAEGARQGIRRDKNGDDRRIDLVV